METKRLATLIGVHPDSVRRWTRRYGQFMSNSATPRTGDTRVYTRHDAAVMVYIATQRETGLSLDQIFTRLKDKQAGQWRDLDAAPNEWFEPLADTEISLVDASNRAAELAQVAVLQNELQHIRGELTERQQRVEYLENELRDIQASERASQGEITALRLDLEAERGKAAALQARIDAYIFAYGFGRDRPLPVAVIIAGTALAAVLVVLVVFIAARFLF